MRLITASLSRSRQGSLWVGTGSSLCTHMPSRGRSTVQGCEGVEPPQPKSLPPRARLRWLGDLWERSGSKHRALPSLRL